VAQIRLPDPPRDLGGYVPEGPATRADPTASGLFYVPVFATYAFFAVNSGKSSSQKRTKGTKAGRSRRGDLFVPEFRTHPAGESWRNSPRVLTPAPSVSFVTFCKIRLWNPGLGIAPAERAERLCRPATPSPRGMASVPSCSNFPKSSACIRGIRGSNSPRVFSAISAFFAVVSTCRPRIELVRTPPPRRPLCLKSEHRSAS